MLLLVLLVLLLLLLLLLLFGLTGCLVAWWFSCFAVEVFGCLVVV